MEQQSGGREGLSEAKRLWKFRYLIALAAIAAVAAALWFEPHNPITGIIGGAINGAFLGACLVGGSYLDQRTLWTRWRGALMVAAILSAFVACSLAFGPKRSYDDPVPYEEPLYRGG